MAIETQKTLSMLRSRGNLAEVTEQWKQGRARGDTGAKSFGRRVDMFGFCDVIELDTRQEAWPIYRIKFYQVTSRANMAARRKKIGDNVDIKRAVLDIMKCGGETIVIGWDRIQVPTKKPGVTKTRWRYLAQRAAMNTDQGIYWEEVTL
jgi:hypothetical protein